MQMHSTRDLMIYFRIPASSMGTENKLEALLDVMFSCKLWPATMNPNKQIPNLQVSPDTKQYGRFGFPTRAKLQGSVLTTQTYEFLKMLFSDRSLKSYTPTLKFGKS